MIILMMTIQLLASPVPLSSRLNAPEERPIAMQGLITRTIMPNPQERADVIQVLTTILHTTEESLTDKIYAIRALGALETGTSSLVAHIQGPFANEGRRVLGIEASKSLARFAPTTTMAKWLHHTDPEIRGVVARLGGSPEQLCALIKSDPWPSVRRSAVYGMSATADPHRCVEAGLSDEVSAVRLASVEMIGESHVLLSETERATVIKRLHALVKDRTQSDHLREQTMQTLGKMGACGAARSALRVYLQSGGLKSLLFASIGALQRCKALDPFIPKLLENDNDQVVLLGLRAAFEGKEDAACPMLKTLNSGFIARRQPQIQDLLNRCAHPAPGNTEHNPPK